jgi:ParB/RepB/Spo0J family partition protein
MAAPHRAIPEEHTVELHELGESHAGLRVLDGGSVGAMRELLRRHGQLMPVVAYAAPEAKEAPPTFEIVDGFKRLRGARELGWKTLRVRVLGLAGAEAKAAISVLNGGRGLSGLEEAWVVRALYREEHLSQPAIGQLLGRDKSWVSRRLLLAEGLDDGVQVDVRLGLLAARTAEALCRLPRGNQQQAAEIVMKQGLTQHQTEHWVKELCGLGANEQEAALEQVLEGLAELPHLPSRGRRRHRERTPAQEIADDVSTLLRVCGRLQARLHARPLVALGAPAQALVGEGLAGLVPVLVALRDTILRITEEPHASMDESRRA